VYGVLGNSYSLGAIELARTQRTRTLGTTSFRHRSISEAQFPRTGYAGNWFPSVPSDGRSVSENLLCRKVGCGELGMLDIGDAGVAMGW